MQEMRKDKIYTTMTPELKQLASNHSAGTLKRKDYLINADLLQEWAERDFVAGYEARAGEVGQLRKELQDERDKYNKIFLSMGKEIDELRYTIQMKNSIIEDLKTGDWKNNSYNL